MSLESSLAVRSVFLNPWHHDEHLRTFYRAPFDGLLDLRENRIRLIAIFSHKPGSGQLSAFMDEIESAADENRSSIQIVQLWNGHLRSWLKRRGYHIGNDKEWGRHADRHPIAA